ncbi:hypothetical protein NIIDMKKI_17890 [Mycobacterium kansasii]|uniref:Uncharacterized protein n=1 Tax=Mycobacterium kansasii TaxID=1768 RepID=A0A7G1I8F4_MYCKA|nr:hypothetical protein NIIDMKKI_17890 [Mycobacterium kansasii]
MRDTHQLKQFHGASAGLLLTDSGLMDPDRFGDLVADGVDGVRADIGSWNTVPITLPRTRDIPSSPRPSSSVPCSRTEPRTSAYSGSSPTTAMAAADLPDPDSPTIATTSPGSTR